MFNAFKVARAQGEKIDCKWFPENFREILEKDKPEGYEKFKGGNSWLCGNMSVI